MLAQSLIHNRITPLGADISAAEALAFMQDWKTTALPVLQDENYLGLLTEDQALDLGEDDPIVWMQSGLKRPFVYVHAHVYEILALMVQWDVPLMPVLDAEEHYLGLVEMSEVMGGLNDHFGLQTKGAILILEMHAHDFVLSHLAKVAEGENVVLQMVSRQVHPDSTKIYVTLRINTDEAGVLIAALERYEYQIVDTFGSGAHGDGLTERYKTLMHYINL